MAKKSARPHDLNPPQPANGAANAASEKAWREQNREAIESCNRHIRKHGIFGSEFRKF